MLDVDTDTLLSLAFVDFGSIVDFGVVFLSILRNDLLNVIGIRDALNCAVVFFSDKNFGSISWRHRVRKSNKRLQQVLQIAFGAESLA